MMDIMLVDKKVIIVLLTLVKNSNVVILLLVSKMKVLAISSLHG
jgi:hypothetical protein